jgi:hypothetical protein
MHREEIDMGVRVGFGGTQPMHGEEMDNTVKIKWGGARPVRMEGGVNIESG